MATINSSGIGDSGTGEPGTADELNNDLTMSVLPVTVFIGIEAFVGFFGNILILLVYYKRYRRINFRYFVLALAIVDLTSCCTTLPGEIFSQLNWYKYEHGWICKVKSYFNVFTAWASASILLSLAIDRYRKICHPFNWQIRFHVAFRLCGCCFLISALVASPVLILWGKMTYKYTFKGENVTVSVCEKSGDYADTLYPLIYIWCVYLVPVSIMIIVAMALNFRTARSLFGRQSTKPDIAKDHSSNIGTSTMMTTESFDRDTDVELETRKEKFTTHDTSNISGKSSDPSNSRGQMKNDIKIKNKEDFGLHVTMPSTNYVDNEQSQGISVDHVTHFKGKTKSVDPTDDYTNGNRQAPNTTGDKLSTDEEISVGYFSGNTQSGENIPDHISSDVSRKPEEHKYKTYRKSKTMIMLVLTSIFAVTMASYIILTVFVAKPGGILKYMPDSEKAVFFFFWRLYFINSVINPILYGFMDARFRSGLRSYIPQNIISKTSSS